MLSLEPTPFDLQMHLFRIPVRVLPTFWLAAAVLGWDPQRFDLMFLWALCMFGSILFHELGHAMTAEAFGYQPTILLYHFGGLAFYHPTYGHTAFRSLLITLAGPLPQLFLGLIVLFGGPLLMNYTGAAGEGYETLWAVWWFLVEINVGWAILNLLPVLPLDGGNATRAILEMLGLRDAAGWALKLSVLVGALITAGFYAIHQTGPAIMFLVLTISNIQQLQARRW